MPRKLRRQSKPTKGAKEEVKMLTTRLLEITVKMDEYIYYNKAISAREATRYLQELNIYEAQFSLDLRSQQVVEKLLNFMRLIVEEEVEELRANGTLGNSETISLPLAAATAKGAKSIETFSVSANCLTPSSFDLNSLDGPIEYERNMDPSVVVNINGNEKNSSQLNESQRIQRSDGIQINNEQVSVLSRSVLRDHNYTSWEGPKYNHDDENTYRTERNPVVVPSRKPRSLVERNIIERNMMLKPVQNTAVAKKYILVKIPGKRSNTPSQPKYIKINASPRRDLNVPPIYARISNKSSKKVFFKHGNTNSSLPKNYLNEKVVEQMAPKQSAITKAAAIGTENKTGDFSSKKQGKKRTSTSKEQSDDEKYIKRQNKRGKRNISQESNVSVEISEREKKKKQKNKLKPNEEDLSWVENLKFVRVIENDEVCTQNINVTDAFWRNLEYPPDWDDGVYLL